VAVRLSGCVEDPSQVVQLLGDIRRVFYGRSADRLASADLCNGLAKLEDRPWGEYDWGRFPIRQKQLAQLLKPFWIASKSVRIANNTPKGYLLTDFEDAFARYLPHTPLPSATPQQASETAAFGDDHPQQEPQHSATVAQPVADREGVEVAEFQGCCAVADQAGEYGIGGAA
jgi:hypothetical protein